MEKIDTNRGNLFSFFQLAHDYRRILTEIKRYGISNIQDLIHNIEQFKALFSHYSPHLIYGDNSFFSHQNEDLDKLIVHNGLSSFTLENTIAVQTNNRVKTIAERSGKKYNIAQIEQQILNCPPSKRKYWVNLYSELKANIFRPFENSLQILQNIACDLKYQSIYDLIVAHSWTDYEKLARIAVQNLENAKDQFFPLYSQTVDVFSIKNQCEIPDVYSNLLYMTLKQMQNFGDYGVKKLFSTLNQICDIGEMEFQPSSRLVLDLDEKPNLTSGACLGFTGDIDNIGYILIGKRGNLGINLHEAGHAIHYLNMDSNLHAIARNFGNMVITEAVAFTFDDLQLNPAFLAEIYESNSRDFEFESEKQLQYKKMLKEYHNIYQAIRFLNYRDIFQCKEPYTPEILIKLREKSEQRYLRYFGFSRPLFDCFEITDQLMISATYFESYRLSHFIQAHLIESCQNTENWWTDPHALSWLKNTIIHPGFSLDLSQFSYM